MKKLNAHTEETESDGGKYTLRKLVKTNTAGYGSVYEKGDRYVVETKPEVEGGDIEAASFKAKADAMRYIKAQQKADQAKAKSAVGGTVEKDPEKTAVHGGKTEDESSDDSEDDHSTGSANDTSEDEAAEKLKNVLNSVKDNDK
ncbi:hypothetical protein [Streptomyces sp. CoH17]|uniref:hypothetical protein n=1 Tax=Streptomyces sp. CoH17 TaxID=2992806 RepID=UPI00226FDAF3|nr:hypothetical protein [Streptomyces sp. CoH17]